MIRLRKAEEDHVDQGLHGVLGWISDYSTNVLEACCAIRSCIVHAMDVSRLLITTMD